MKPMGECKDNTMPDKRCFLACKCPHCKAELGEVPEDAKCCPYCNADFDVGDVWATRRYSGLIQLPNWIIFLG